ncbi:urease accessory protein UreD [uncultured Mycolicibacterium sp.]|uniref:urease accessory protein UreD n=1 Tax=uncultured Mycolicibacterium sp. TaxID=2320817 RepID=UPI0026133EBA|nr:urease accessory protein UreD [uncultured Mycolicibacterium sp.]
MTAPALDLVFAAGAGHTALSRRRHRWPLLVGRVFGPEPPCRYATVIIQNAAGAVIPGDRIVQRFTAVDGAVIAVRGQGATTVTGVPGGPPAAEEAVIHVDATSRLVFDPGPRILTPHARYRQQLRVHVAPGGCAVVVDAVVLHPDLTDDSFGRFESTVVVAGGGPTPLAVDAQVLETLPRPRRAPTAFASIYVVGAEAVATTAPQAPADRRVYLAASELPNGAGGLVRVAAADGGALREAVAAIRARLASDTAATADGAR